jgi:hypothetical protein
VNVKNVVTKWLLEVLNVPPATLEIKPRVNQKSLVSRPAIGFIISGAPHFRNPYLTKVTNQLGSPYIILYLGLDKYNSTSHFFRKILILLESKFVALGKTTRP